MDDTTAEERADNAEYLDALARLRRIYSFLNMTNEAIARIKEPLPLFEEACRIAVEVGGFRMAWIGLTDPETGQIKPVAHDGFEEGYLEKIFVSADESDSQGRGPTGTATRTGQINICRDFSTDPRMAPWREEALRRGYLSSGAFPLRIGDRVVGALTLYAAEKDFFTEEEVDLFKSLAENISLAIDAMEKEELRRVAEDELALRAQLLDAATDSIFVYDTDGNFIYANEACRRTRGYTRDELMAMNLHELATPECAALIDERESGAQGEGEAIFESTHLRKDGSVMEVEVHNRPIEAAGRTLFLSVARDITERKRVDRELSAYRDHLEDLVDERTRYLQYLNRELESFSYSVSHDLRGPIRAIDGFSHMLLEDYGEHLDDEGRQSFEYIFSSIKRIDETLDGLLRLARAGSQEIEFAEFDLGQLVAGVIEELKHDVGERDIEFRVGELDPASCDAALVRQVFSNLLANAVKFTRENDRAIIEVLADERDGERVYIVRDNGVGFEEEQAERMFGVFQRLHGSDRFEGSGVGLAIVQRIVIRHGGRIWAEGARGEGAAFYFTLPAPRHAEP
jgi:PAS domain S-box-containing protein